MGEPMQESGPKAKILRFGECDVDLRAGQLYKRGLKVSLRDQSFRVLALLLERPGEVVTREELRRRLWPEDVFVDFDNNLNTAVARLREALCDSADHPRFIETLPKRGYRFVASVAGSAEAGSTRKAKLAVLPFANLSGDPAEEYFSDGLTEEMIGQLAGLAPDRLGVIARTTAMHYKGSHKDVARIGLELGLDYVLEGSVRREGGQVRISAQLIQVSDQTHLWSRTYDAELRHILKLQSEVAQAVAAQIEIAVPQTGKRRTGAVDPEAHDAYLKGLYHLSRLNPSELEKAAECFRRAIQTGPGYAQAHAKLALVHSFAGYFGYAAPSEAFPKAEAAAAKALELHDGLADAHFALGLVHWFHTWDLPAAERDIDRAVELSPNDPNGHFGRAMFLASMKEDHPVAAIEMSRARELDPLSMMIRVSQGWVLYWARQYDRLIVHARETIELDENCVQAYNHLGLAYIATAAPGRAVAALEEAARRFGDPLSLAWLGMACAEAGEPEKARAVLRRMEETAASGYMPSLCLSWVHVGLRENQAALDLIAKAYDEHDPVVLWLRVSPSFDALRGEPRYAPMVARLNLPPKSR
jgi:TolB-like protein/Flp pilus assembly protein TadD